MLIKDFMRVPVWIGLDWNKYRFHNELCPDIYSQGG